MSAAGPAGPTEEQVTAATFDRINAETRKLMAEQSKLAAEARKFNRDPWFVLVGAVIAILAGVAARLPELLHTLGLGR